MSIGDGATSEGEFWESLNTACTRIAPVLFLVEDNGYAISVPVEVQTPGGDISRLVESFPNLKVLRCDGTDFLESYRDARRGGRVDPPRAQAGAACTPRCIAALLALALRRRAALQDAGGARGRSAARSAHADARVPARPSGLATDAELDAIAADVDREIAEATDARAGRAEADGRDRRTGTSTRPTSIRPRRRSRRRSSPTASPTRWSRPSTAR